MRETTSHTNLRLTSATVMPPAAPPAGRAIVMYGSVSLRKYTGLYQVLPPLASVNLGSCERSVPLPTTSIARRDTRSCSRPGLVEPRDLGDRGRLAQELQVFVAPLLDDVAPGGDLRQRRPAELVLDVVDVLLDAGRGGDRLLALQRDEVVLVLQVGEVEADAPAREQRRAHQR